MQNFSILYQNEEIIIVNKPAGIPVQGGVGISHSLDDELSLCMGFRVHLVHRLDKETAGILLVAKTSVAAAKWTKLIASHQVKKEYYAVCVGAPLVNGREQKQGTLVGKVESHGKVQEAQLHFCVEKTGFVNIESLSENIKLSYVHVTLGTGRMHQIRIQLAKAFCPIAADDQHGDFKKNKLIRKLGIKKLQLVAKKLTLPIDGTQKTFEIELPEHIQKTVNTFFCG